MALTFSLVDTWDDGKRIHVSRTVSASGNYSTGGDTLDLSQFPAIATTQNNGKVKIFARGTTAGAFRELAAGAYPAAITGDTMTFYGIFRKLQ
jgi:hypothetical protein